jgi:hypothetical protein
MMVEYELDRGQGILIIRPEGALEADDFQRIAIEVDPFIEAKGKLRGIMIEAKSFPGWKDFAALVAHLRFIRNHHRKVERIAAVSDSGFLAAAPKIATHFVQAEIRHFPNSQKEEALTWLRAEA